MLLVQQRKVYAGGMMKGRLGRNGDELFGLHSIILMCCRTPSISQKHMCCKWLTWSYSQMVNCIVYNCSHRWSLMVHPLLLWKIYSILNFSFSESPSHSCALCTIHLFFGLSVKNKTMYILWIPPRSQHSIEKVWQDK